MNSMAPVEAAIQQGPVVIFRWRNAPGWPVEYCSPNAAEVFGYSAEEFMRGDVAYADLIAPTCLERVGEEVQTATETGVASFVHEPYEVIHRDGTPKWLYDATQIVRDESGAATHYVGYVIDVTDRIRAEQEKRELENRLLHSQKLESLGVLAGGVAHDFNNILTGILGHAALAAELLEPGQEANEHIESVISLSQKAAELTRQLLAYSGRGHFVVSALDLCGVVHDMGKVLEVAVSKKAKLRIECEGVNAVLADRSQVQQIVMNLITNASEALQDKPGTIDIRINPRQLDADTIRAYFEGWSLAPGAYVSLSVADDGCGMNEETRARLFDPFFSTKVSGRGLGMSAVIGIVRGHRGGLRVATAPGEGSTFEVVFPSTEQDVAVATPAPAREPWRGEGTVLVVDDQTDVSIVVCRMLEHLGFTTLCAKDGAEGLAEYEAHRDRIVLLLVDRTMPVMDGEELLGALIERGVDVPVVMTSGYDESDEKAGVVATRTAGFLQKPYRLEDLEDVVRAALSGGAAARADRPGSTSEGS